MRDTRRLTSVSLRPIKEDHMALTEVTFQRWPLTVAVGNGVKVGRRVHDDTHLISGGKQHGHELLQTGNYKGMWKVRITPGTGTVFLPFEANKVTSVLVPHLNRTLFLTENLSGCCFCVGRNSQGTLVAFHANALKKSAGRDSTGRFINWQHDDVEAELVRLMRQAMDENSVQHIDYWCDKPDYLKGAADRFGRAGFSGGTTIAGFNSGTKWSFWFQTWGTSRGGNTVRMIECRKFWEE